MKIELRISPAHFGLSLILSHHQINHFYYGNGIYGVQYGFRYENDCLLNMTHVTQGGAPAPFHFIVGFSSGRCESETLVVSNSRNQTSPKPIIYVDIWIYDCWSTVNLITIHIHHYLVSLASPRFRALPPTTNTIQNKRYCSH